MLHNPNVVFAFILTLLAGLATGIGSAISIISKKTNTKVLSLALGFSAGVMIYVSMMEILSKSFDVLYHEYGKSGGWFALISFFGGIALTGIIDIIVPSAENPHEIKRVETMPLPATNREQQLMRLGLLSALAIGIHNFPEGMATFVAALHDTKVGIPIAIAIALHNIPEGIAVAVPIFHATKSRRKAFVYSFISGLAEPVGALIGFLILLPYMSDTIFGIIFGCIAGIMVFISVDELLPSAIKYGEHHYSILGFISGMFIMSVSLILLQ